MSAKGERYESELATFKTAVRPDTPFAFTVISDTQGNPKVSSTIATAWMQRPSFSPYTQEIWCPPAATTIIGRSISSPACGH